jgi:hypothetical protein
MCIVMSAIVIALYRTIRVVCLHNVSIIAIGAEGADQGKEEPSRHHVAPGMSLPHKPSHLHLCTVPTTYHKFYPAMYPHFISSTIAE